MNKKIYVIRIFLTFILCALAAATGFGLSKTGTSATNIPQITLSEETAAALVISDKEAGYELPPLSAPEPLEDSGQWKTNESGQYYYENPDGSLAIGWQNIDDTWYYLDNSGIMLTGWVELDGVWYYLDTDGEMLTGWVKDNGIWYYFNDNGTMASNCTTPDGYWVNGSGALAVQP